MDGRQRSRLNSWLDAGSARRGFHRCGAKHHGLQLRAGQPGRAGFPAEAWRDHVRLSNENGIGLVGPRMPCFCTRRGRHRPTPGTFPTSTPCCLPSTHGHRRWRSPVRLLWLASRWYCATSPRRMLGTGDVARGVGSPFWSRGLLPPRAVWCSMHTSTACHTFIIAVLLGVIGLGAGASHLVLLILK